AYEDVASKFFEHFVAIADAMNTVGGDGLWDESDGFYYDQMHSDGKVIPMKVRSMVGLIPLIAVTVLDQTTISRLPGFQKRMRWFLENRRDLGNQISYMQPQNGPEGRLLLAIPSRERLERVVRYMLDENEFLSPYGIRSLSRYHHFYGDRLQVEYPSGSGNRMNLAQVARELNRRLAKIFLPDNSGWSPWQGGIRRFADDPHWRNLVLFYEYFHADNGAGLGASHQTGWTSLVVRALEDLQRETDL